MRNKNDKLYPCHLLKIFLIWELRLLRGKLFKVIRCISYASTRAELSIV